MDWLEKELSQALERKEPSPDFAARVRRGSMPSETALRSRTAALPRGIPPAPLDSRGGGRAVIVGGSGLAWRRHQGMVAKDQVMLAMRITAGKLNHMQTHMREAEQ